MRTLLFASILVFSTKNVILAQDTISPKTLTAIKKATVFVKVEAGDIKLSGSGFAVKREGDGGLVVTNLHVIEPKLQVEVQSKGPVGEDIELTGGKSTIRRPTIPSRPPTIIRPPTHLGPQRSGPGATIIVRPSPRTMVLALKNANISLVFDSGTATERSAKASVVAVDPDNDLAVLRADVKDFPDPIGIEKLPELIETATVYSFGFPFGNVLATGKGSPAITVGKAAISSLRNDDDGELAIVQIDGGLNPGNSGGPIISAGGQLVGVAVATIKNANNIGLVIPGEQVKRMFAGRIGDVSLIRPAGNEKSVNVEVGLVDPVGKIRSATLLYCPAESVKGELGKLRSLEEVADVKKVNLSLEKQLALGTFDFDGPRDRELLVQVVYSKGAKEESTRVGKLTVKSLEVAKAAPPAVNPPPRIGPPAKNPPPNPPLAKRDPGLPSPVVQAWERESNPSHWTPPMLFRQIHENGNTHVAGDGSAVVTDDAPEGGVVTGFECSLWDEYPIMVGIKAIYQTPMGEQLGPHFGIESNHVVITRAKKGYAVGGIVVRTTLDLSGFYVIYMKIKDNGMLDVADTYQSEWIGSRGDRAAEMLGATGAPVVGILTVVRRDNQRLNGLGLRLAPAPADAVVEPTTVRPTRKFVPMERFPLPEVQAREALANPSRCERPLRPLRIFNDGETELFGSIDAFDRDLAPEGGYLIGFELGLAERNVIVAVRPIYRSAKGETLGGGYGRLFDRKTIAKAKAGYAVGAIGIRRGAEGMYLVYMKVKPDMSLDPSDTYQSEWVGAYDGEIGLLGGTGAPVDGVTMNVRRRDLSLESLGLKLKSDIADAAPLEKVVIVSPPLTNSKNPSFLSSPIVFTVGEFQPAKGAPMFRLPLPAVQETEKRKNPARADNSQFRLMKIFSDGETDMVGPTHRVFKELAPAGGLLTGLQLGFGKFNNNHLIVALKPIYETPGGEKEGEPFGFDFREKAVAAAKPGYAIGGIVARPAGILDGLYVIFMKIKPDGTLDVNDTYQSDWYGSYSGGPPHLVGGTGSPIIGLIGSIDNERRLCGLALKLKN